MIDRAETPQEKREMLERLLTAWEKCPQQRLGQLLVNTLRGENETLHQRLFYVEDFALARLLEK